MLKVIQNEDDDTYRICLERYLQSVN